MKQALLRLIEWISLFGVLICFVLFAIFGHPAPHVTDASYLLFAMLFCAIGIYVNFQGEKLNNTHDPYKDFPEMQNDQQ